MTSMGRSSAPGLSVVAKMKLTIVVSRHVASVLRIESSPSKNLISRNVSQIDQLLNGNALGLGVFFSDRIENYFHSFQRRLAIVGRRPQRTFVHHLAHLPIGEF